MAGKCGTQKTRAELDSLTIRSCLRCQKDFKSEGIHNRLCDACKTGEGVTRGFSTKRFVHSDMVSKKGGYG